MTDDKIHVRFQFPSPNADERFDVELIRNESGEWEMRLTKKSLVDPNDRVVDSTLIGSMNVTNTLRRVARAIRK